MHYNFNVGTIFDPPALFYRYVEGLLLLLLLFFFFFFFFFSQKFESINELSEYSKSEILQTCLLVRVNLERVRPSIIIPGHKILCFRKR